MRFKFIHTADWQIGAPFGAFETKLAARLTDARLEMINTIGNLAMARHVRHVLVAGDVWDSEQPSKRVLHQPLDLMKRYDAVTWWLMPGNHDPFRPNLLWSEIETYASPNIKLLLKAEPVEAEPSVWLLPAPWTTKSPGRDLTTWMDNADLPPNRLTIGIGHGSITEFSSDDEHGDVGSKSIIDPRRANEAQLDYLALGDWHGVQKISDRVWYSGTPETDRFRRNSPGHVLIVELETDTLPKVQVEKTTTFHWHIVDIDCVPEMKDFPAIDELEGRGSLRNILAQINLTGHMKQQNWLKLDARLRLLEERLDFMNIQTDHLTHLVSSEDLDNLDRAGSVRMAAERLLERKENPSVSEEDRKTADNALCLLLSYANEEFD